MRTAGYDVRAAPSPCPSPGLQRTRWIRGASNRPGTYRLSARTGGTGSAREPGTGAEAGPGQVPGKRQGWLAYPSAASTPSGIGVWVSILCVPAAEPFDFSVMMNASTVATAL